MLLHLATGNDALVTSGRALNNFLLLLFWSPGGDRRVTGGVWVQESLLETFTEAAGLDNSLGENNFFIISSVCFGTGGTFYHFHLSERMS